MNVILSTFGPLHLIKGANYICNYVNLTILQGWLPTPRQQWLVNLLSKIIHKDLNKSFKKRKCDGALSNIGLALPEFFYGSARWFLIQDSQMTKQHVCMASFVKNTYTMQAFFM